MSLFLLQPNPDRDLKRGINGSPGDPFNGHDINTGFVIRADSEEEARGMAKENANIHGDEMYSNYERWIDEDTTREDLEEDGFAYYDGIWTNENLVRCTELEEDGTSEIVLNAFKRG